ncbi:MAG: glucose-6-phosphate isomerase [Betaproteobacteria bacterium]|nr:glucose-6-phosphate isomerase [Betaproteobacteria bacterium]
MNIARDGGPDSRALFAAEPERFAHWSFQCGDLLVDFSKQRWHAEALAALLALAEQTALSDWINALFAGAHVNNTEDRAAMHWALRRSTVDVNSPSGLETEVLRVRKRMYTLAEGLRGGRQLGATGRPLSCIVNLGIGGSDLGPRLVCDALIPFAQPNLRAAFVANVDGAELSRVLHDAPPESTLFVVTSKTFTTQETLRNALSARDWLRAKLGAEASIGAHFLAVTANPSAAGEFGIDAERILPMWDWVGGRYSVWSAVGFTVAAMIGPAAFELFLKGAAVVDEHFRKRPLARNVPVLMAMVGIWNRNFLGYPDHAVVPYARGLELFAAYLQQLEMESNGKSVARDGKLATPVTCPAVWGTVGTSGQHAYFQWLHQGTLGAPVDFVLIARGESRLPDHQEMLLANALAQAQALLHGKEQAVADAEHPGAPQLAAQRSFAGGRPSTTLVLPELDPFHLGQLLALYEHKTFAQGVLWGVNPFDQWGVELGKTLAAPLLNALRGGLEPNALDGSTRGLLRHLLKLRQS